MKKIIKRIFSLIGIGIYRIPRDIKNNSLTRPVFENMQENFALHHNSLENVNRIFSDSAQMDQYLTPSRLKFYEELIQLTTFKKIDLNNKKIADVGCGTGHLVLQIKNISKPNGIVGLDFSEEAVNFSKKIQPDVSFFVHDIYRKFNDKFDVVFCTEVLEHLLYPESAIHNLKEMLLPDSACIITVPNGRIDTFMGHINFWSPESWEKFMCDQFKGFQIETGTFMNNTVNYSIVRKFS